MPDTVSCAGKNGSWPQTQHLLSRRTLSRREPATRITAFMWATVRWCTTEACRAAGGPDRWKKCLSQSLRADARSGFALT